MRFPTVLVVLATEPTKVRGLVLMTELARKLTKRTIGTILTLGRRHGGCRSVEVRRLLLAEVRRVTSDTLLRSLGDLGRLSRGLAETGLEVRRETMLGVLLVMRKQARLRLRLRLLLRELVL